MTLLDTQHTILIVGANRTARAFLGDNLSADGFEVLEAGALTSARQILAHAVVELLIVDRELPDADGLDLLRFIREADHPASRIDSDLPVIVIAGDSSPLDRIRAYERGCDEYLVRDSISYPELRARIGVLLRRGGRLSRIARLRVGSLEIDALSRQAWVDGRPVRLASKEFSLLLTLAREPGRVFRRSELMATIWGWGEGESGARTRTLDSHVSRLRRKLAVHGDCYIVNVWGIGYRLVDLSASEAAIEPRQLADLSPVASRGDTRLVA